MGKIKVIEFENYYHVIVTYNNKSSIYNYSKEEFEDINDMCEAINDFYSKSNIEYEMYIYHCVGGEYND